MIMGHVIITPFNLHVLSPEACEPLSWVPGLSSSKTKALLVLISVIEPRQVGKESCFPMGISHTWMNVGGGKETVMDNSQDLGRWAMDSDAKVVNEQCVHPGDKWQNSQSALWLSTGMSWSFAVALSDTPASVLWQPRVFSGGISVSVWGSHSPREFGCDLHAQDGQGKCGSQGHIVPLWVLLLVKPDHAPISTTILSLGPDLLNLQVNTSCVCTQPSFPKEQSLALSSYEILMLSSSTRGGKGLNPYCPCVHPGSAPCTQGC